MLTLALVIISLAFFAYLKFRKRIVCDIPGPKSYPLVGTALLFITAEPLQIICNLQNQYGNIFRIWLGPDLFVTLIDPADIEVILTSYKHISKSSLYNFMKEWLGNGLITSDGDTWHTHRKFLNPTFHLKILQNSIEIMDKNGKILVEQLASKATEGKEFDLEESLEKCSLDIIGEVAMGVKLNTQTSNDNDKYLHAVKLATNVSTEKMSKIWFQFDILFKHFGQYNEYRDAVGIIENVSKGVIASRRQQITESKETASDIADSENAKKKSRSSFLDSMLLGSNFTDDEIHDEVMSFMFAGYDTTTISLSFCLYELANYQDIQEKVYQEIMEILPSDDCPTIQTLTNLRYMEKVIKETLRLYPPAPAIARTILEPVTLPSGYTVPANTQLGIFIYGMHRCAKYFPEPEKFIPERFDPENKRHPFSYIPFSAGPRNCIGQKLAMLEMKTLIANFLKNYKLLPSEKPEPLELSMQVILRVKGGLPIRIIKRT